ncbi:MAG: hypothetical protein V4674_02970 [Patescibacteria group bacterium]
MDLSDIPVVLVYVMVIYHRIVHAHVYTAEDKHDFLGICFILGILAGIDLLVR